MMNRCPAPSDSLGIFRSVLGAVDCNVHAYSKEGYLALTGPNSFFPAAVTVLLTVYVAVLGYRLMFGIGRTRLSDAPIMALKIGMILALTVNWSSFQTLVFDLSSRAPVEIAQVISRPAVTSGATLAADPLGGLQIVYDELTLDAAAFWQKAGPNPQVLRGGEAAAADALWKARSALFISTVGILAISSILVGALIAIGPIFIALFLFVETRGLFVGWLRAVVTVMLVPMICWMTAALLLVVIEPWLIDLAQGRNSGQLDPQAATIVCAILMIFAAAQAAITIGATMIASGFQLHLGPKSTDTSHASSASVSTSQVSLSRADRLAMSLRASPSVSRLENATGSERPASSSLTLPSSGQGRARISGPYNSYRRDAHLDRFRKFNRSA